MVTHSCAGVRLKRVCFHKQSHYSVIVGLGAVTSHPPGPCPCLANWTRCSGVKSVKCRFGSGGRSIWPGSGCPCGVLALTSMLDLGSSCARQPVRASHNPPVASSAAIARNRCFLFIVFSFLILSLRDCVRISGSWLSIWNEGGEFWCEAPASRNEPDPQPSRLHA